MPDLRQQLTETLTGRVCLFGLGNVDLGDDAFGVRLAEAVQTKLRSGSLRVILAGTQPERWLGRLGSDPLDHLVMLDAVECGAVPGTVLFLGSAALVDRFPQVSTHRLSLNLLAKLMEVETGAQVWLLGVQPETLRPGAELSAAVRGTLELLVEWLDEALSDEQVLTV